MNYVWDFSIRARQQGVHEDSITYKCAKSFSPYIELSFIDLNQAEAEAEVEINPYIRYYNIFKELFNPNEKQYKTARDVMFDIIVHHLADIDILQGMNKREYQIRFILRCMKEGYFHKTVKTNIESFNNEEQKIIANNVLRLYTTGEAAFYLKDTVKSIFKHSYIFANAREKYELIFFLREKETPEKVNQIELIKEIFTPINYEIEIFWEHIFGVIEVEELMVIDNMLIY